ncbi:MAG: WD40 repeat domain-containing protein, partial [Ardenticatenaceae bacterium]
TPFENWGLQKIGYPISQRYVHDGFVTQAFQKAIMQWRAESGTVALVNIFDDLHKAGFDGTLLSARQTPRQLPAGWDGDIGFDEVVQKRQALLAVRPALQETYFASSDPLTFYGLPTSEVEDMGNHYAVRLQRAVLQEWKEEVPWAKEGEVTIANGGDIAKELGGLPAEGLIPIPPESGGQGSQAGQGSEGGEGSAGGEGGEAGEGSAGGEGGEGGASVGTFFNHLNIVDIAWANDHKLAVGAADGIWLYDTNALDSEPLLLSGSEGLLSDLRNATTLTISHNGEWLALALDDYKIRLWSLTSNDPPNVLAEHTTHVRALAFSRDNTMLASAGGSASGSGFEPYEFEDTEIRLWDLVSGDVTRLPMPKDGIINTLAFAPALEGSPDGAILMAGVQSGFGGRSRSCDGSIRRWHVESGEEISSDLATSPITFSADGRFAVNRTCHEGTMQLWDMTSGSELYRTPPGAWPSGTRFSSNGTRFAVISGIFEYGRAYQMRVWDQATGAELATLSTTGPIDLSPDGRLLASGNSFTEHKVGLWDIEQKKRLAVLAEHDEPVTKVRFSPDGAWLASASENTVQLSPVPEAPTSAPPPSLATTSFQLSPIQAMVWANEHTLAVAAEDSMWLYDSNTPDGPQPLPGELGTVTSLAVSPSSAESSLLAAGLDAENSGQILLWSLASDEPPKVLADHTRPVQHLAFSPDGTRLASGGGYNHVPPSSTPDDEKYEDTDVRLWDVVSSDVTRLPNNGGQVTALAFSSDGALLMVGTDDALNGPDLRCDGTLRQVDLSSGVEISTHRVATPITFSADGQHAATGTCDNPPVMQLWNLATGSAYNIASPSNIDRGQHWAHDLTFSQNQASLAATIRPFGLGGDNPNIYSTLVWDVATGAELAMLPSHRPMALSPNGRLAALAHRSEKHEVWLWDVQQNQLLASYEHDSPLIQIAFSPDGAWLASASQDRTLKLANVQSFRDHD